jgi:hypothetical protein
VSNNIRKVTIAIETESGEGHMLVVVDPNPWGSNPAFMSQQFEAALADLGERGHALIQAVYGNQIRVE